jgi:hypothetical protein
MLPTVLLLACGRDGSSSNADLAGDGRGEAAGPADGRAKSETRPEPRFDHEVFVHSEAAGRSGIATGEFGQPSFSYPEIPVDSAFIHLLNFRMTPFLPPDRTELATHGPLILYSDTLETIVFSPLDNFFSSLVSFEHGAIRYGLHGEIDNVPDGFVHRFILVRGQGINATVAEWGRLLLEDRGKVPPDRYADTGLSYLGYWTDNGAAYYYKKAEGMNEAETLLAVKQEAEARAIPLRYVQIDSWWYFKDGTAGLWPPAGLILWEPRPEVFPEGLAAFHEALGLPLIAHNRWFAKENAYLEEDEFVFGPDMALPTGQKVYDHFMSDAAAWGIETYEQDWLVNQYWGIPWLREEPGRAETWMANMDRAAAQQGLTMQLCMPAAAHLMDSVDRSSVTTIRTSTDYSPGISKESYWPMFHTVNMLAAAVGLWPFKDNFRTAETWGEAEALVSALSAGMVGPGDEIGAIDPELVARTCRADGLLLKPDRPATPIDAMFIEHERPFTTWTWSDLPGLGRTYYVAAYHLAEKHPERTVQDRAWFIMQYDMAEPDDLFVLPDAVSDWHLAPAADLGAKAALAAYDWRSGTAWPAGGGVGIPPTEHLYDFSYLVLAPIQSNGLALIGEAGKYVTLSDRRFLSATPDSTGFEIELAGAPGEVVQLLAWDSTTAALLEPVEVSIAATGTASARLDRTR